MKEQTTRLISIISSRPIVKIEKVDLEKISQLQICLDNYLSTPKLLDGRNFNNSYWVLERIIVRLIIAELKGCGEEFSIDEIYNEISRRKTLRKIFPIKAFLILAKLMQGEDGEKRKEMALDLINFEVQEYLRKAQDIFTFPVVES